MGVPDTRDGLSQPGTLVELLRLRAIEQGGKRAYTFLLDGEAEEAIISFGELDRQARAIAARLQSQDAAGQRALLLYPPGLEFIAAYFGCLYAGVIAVPAYPPRLNRPSPRIEGIVTDAGATVALTTTPVLEKLERRFEHMPALASLEWLNSDQIDETLAAQWVDPRVEPEALAFLQYTSGSTSAPKGVMVSHSNLIHNLAIIQAGFQIDSRARGVFWLPSYHDMGLIGGILEPMYVNGHSLFMAPAAFLQRPARWLQAISRDQGTISGAPNFAYQMAVDKVTEAQCEGLDLSTWSIAFCGAEPIREETLAQFVEKFAPYGFRPEAFYPCYGLAEGTLLVAGGNGPARPTTLTLRTRSLSENRAEPAAAGEGGTQTVISCGHTLLDQEIAIVDPETGRRLEPNEVGEIWVSGRSVAQGYWNRPELTRETFGAHLASGQGPFLCTGDLGFEHEGQLYVSGRLKDLIIIRGRNHYPQDIEGTVAESHPAFETGMGAAFAVTVESQEQLVVAYELKRSHRRADVAEVTAAARAAIATNHGLQPHAIVLLKPLSIPKTSSGKIKRHACRAGFLEGGLDVVGEWRADSGRWTADDGRQTADDGSIADLQSLISQHLAARLKIAPEQVDVQRPFVDYGLDSVQAVELIGEMESVLGRPLSPTLVWDYPNVAALAAYLAQSEEQAAASVGGSVEQPAREPIAVIGIGCRFPGAEGPEQFWQLLRDGVDAIAEVPADRWNIDEFYGTEGDAAAPGMMNTRWGGFLADVDRFDPHFFGISPREAQRMDPQQRLLLEVAWEALERAGQRPSRLAGSRTGVFVGVSSYDYSRLQFSDPAQIDAYAGTGNAHSIAANRLSYLLDLRGPSMAIDTACSSSLVATHLAIQSLRSGESELALAGGVNLLLAPELSITFSQARMMAADGRCKTFDARADGYVRGEGAGMIVLKRLSDAVRDGDPILALLRGSALNQDGRSNGLTAPNGPAQQAVIRQALADAGAAPSDLSYIEAHGTGTPLGDPIEVQSLRAVLDGEDGPGNCFLGSVKTNVGHLEAAAGVAGLIKVILSLQAQEIPPHLHFQELNPYISLDGSPLRIASQRQPWSQNAKPRLAGVSSFGFGGTNAHVIVGDWQPREEEREVGDEATGWAYLLPLSAKSEPALVALVQRYRTHLQSVPDQLLPAICHTAATGRDHLGVRTAFIAHDRDELLQQLNDFQPAPIQNTVARLAFLFTGQGSQYPGMARGLYESQPVFRATLDHCADILQGELDEPLLDIIFSCDPISNLPATEALERPLQTVHQTAYTQPALFAVEYALAQLWRSWGIVPDLLLGHSVGEYVAACLAGVFSLEDGLRLVAARGRLMQALPQNGSMAVVFAGREEVRRVLLPLDGNIAVAAVNGPQNVTISGTEQAVSSALQAFEAQGLEVRPLTVSHAFHSPLMAPILEQFEALASSVTFKPPQIPLISNVTGCLFGPDEVPDAAYWREHVRQPVDFAGGVRALAAEGANFYLEVGPQPHLLPLVRRTLQASTPAENGAAPILALPSLRRQEAEAQTMTASLAALYMAGLEVDWDGVYAGRRQRRVALPTYPFQRQRYWLDVASPALRRAALTRSGVTRLDTALPLYEAVYRLQAHGDFAAFLQDTLQAVAADFWGGEGHVVHLTAIPAPAPETTVAVQIALWPLSAELLTCQLFTRLEEEQGWQPAGSASLERGVGDDGRQTADGGRGLETAATGQSLVSDFQFTDYGSQIIVQPTVGDLPSAMAFLQPHAAQVLGLAPEHLDPRQPLDTLGMDSLMAIELRNRIESEMAVTLPVVALLEGASVEQLAEKLLIYLEEAPDGHVPIVAGEHAPGAPFPLSYGQQAMWFLHQLLPEDIAFNVAGAVRLRGVLDVDALRRAWQRLVRRHPALRTAFTASDSGPVQVVREDVVPAFRQVDAERWEEDAVQAYLQREAYRPFDLEQGAPWRMVLLRRGAEEHIVLLSVNHIVADFWSMALLVRELTLFYATERGGVGVQLPPPTVHYADYVAWQQKLLQGEQGERLRDYWLQQLSGELPLLDLPSDRPRPTQQTFFGDTASRLLDPQLARKVQALAQSQGATLATTLLAAFQALLQRYSGQEQVMVGSVFSGREQSELADLVGYLINPVALRADFGEQPSFSQLLQQVRQTMLDAFAHQAYPLPLLAEQLPLQRDPGRPPLFETMFIMQKAQVMEEQGLNALALGMPGARMEMEGLSIESLALGGLPAQFDLTLMMAEVDEGLAASGLAAALHYNTALFDKETAERLLAHLEMLLQGVTAQPDLPLARIPLLSVPERRQILEAWNDTQTAPAASGCLQQLIEAQVARSPQAPAVHFGSQSLTYDQLNRRANQLAHVLRRRGVAPDTLVAVAVERSLEMLVAVLGVLKAGGAYVPLDPAFPLARLQLMLEDAQPAVLLTQQSLLDQLPATEADVICVDSEWEAMVAVEPDHNPDVDVTAENLAYVIYTSGSTGRPKGVQIEHRAVTNFLHSMGQRPGLAADDVLLAVTTLSFDIAVLELYLPLLAGAQVVIAPTKAASDATRLMSLMEEAGATVMQATPATWRMLLEAGWGGREELKVLCGGEALSPALARELLPRCGELWNMYGPTETTVWSTIHRVTDGEGPVPIGRPIANTSVYILDDALQPVPVGVAGELYIGGEGLARGYLHRPELTAERFVAVHSLRGAGESQRLYKTGDLARYRADGSILYLGRRDQQVKVRGYRIELGDVEAALARHPALRLSVVVARSTTPADDAAKQLVAYVVAAEGQTPPDGSELRRFLRQRLPDYMVPAAFVPMEALPLTPNNKVDRRALPEPPQSRPATAAPYVAPRTLLEEELVVLCSEVLKADAAAIGVDDDFFDLGGNSLLATRLIFQVREQYQVQIPLRHLFVRPTIAGLAEAISAAENGNLATDNGQWHMTVEALKAEAVLDADIDGGGQSYRPVERIQQVLLTGATGFVGAFLLRDLLQETEAIVHCLVRADDAARGLARLRRNLEQYGLWEAAFAERIVPLPGDLSRQRLGLEEAHYERLAREIDAIYHNGALVNFVYPYSAHKAANVLGTQELLRLAARERLKPLHFVSTLSVFHTGEHDDGTIFAEGDDLEETGAPFGGYAQSKWVAEKLVQEAGARGIPVAIYRPGLVSGDSRSGAWNTDDMMTTLARISLALGAVPQLDTADKVTKVDLVPVDYVSAAIVTLSQQSASIGRTFHLSNPRPLPYVELLGWLDSWATAAETSIEPLPFAEWRERLVHLALQAGGSEVNPFLPLIEEVSAEQVFMPDIDCANTEAGLVGSGISCTPVGPALLQTYLAYFAEKGIVPAALAAAPAR